MFFQAGPLVIKSELELSLTQGSQGECNSTLSLVKNLPDSEMLRVSSEESLLWTDQGVWLFHDKAATGFVSIDSNAQILSEETGLSLYMTSLLALRVLAVQKGAVLLHASAVANNGVARVWIGESGSGKSTRAAQESLKGAVHLNDDIVPLIFDNQGRVCTFQLDRFASLFDSRNPDLREFYSGLPAPRMNRRDGKSLYQLSGPDAALYPISRMQWLQNNGSESDLDTSCNKSIGLLLHNIIGRGVVQKMAGKNHLLIIAKLLEQANSGSKAAGVVG
jgi:hypothetical protein